MCAELIARGHRVRGFDRVPSPALADGVVGDVANPDDLARALEGMATAVHLAATPDEADFLTHLLPNNAVGPVPAPPALRGARRDRDERRPLRRGAAFAASGERAGQACRLPTETA